MLALNPDSEEARARRRVYQAQLSKLEEMQMIQRKQEIELASREKLLGQQQKYLTAYQVEGSQKVLLERIQELEAQVKSLQEEQDQNKINKPFVGRLNQLGIFGSKMQWEGQEYPAFVFVKPPSVDFAQRIQLSLIHI